VEKHLQSRPNYEEARKNRTTWSYLGVFLSDLPGDLRAEAEAFFREREYDVSRAGRHKESWAILMSPR
jgi:hypothetical protein